MQGRVRQPAKKKAQQLLSALLLSKDEIRTRLAQASDPAYWRALYPRIFSSGKVFPGSRSSAPRRVLAGALRPRPG